MTRYADPQLIPDNIVKLMSPETRQELGLLTPEERSAKVNALAERDLQRLCEQELNRQGIAFLHLSPMAREKAGWPDLVFAIAGIPFAVELKTQAGKLSAEQEHMLARMQANGWTVHVVRSYEAFRALINVG